MFKNSFVKHEDRLYIVKKVLRDIHNPNIEAWKWYTASDLVLRKEGLLHFVELIPDLEIVEELK